MPVQTQLQQRRGTAASWTSANPTLAAGEIGFESDTNRFKIGNGSTAWASLSYWVQDPVTTKGDLYTFSTTDTRLPVGANGESLVADSSATTGLRYQANFSAGKNKIINGDMSVWQRGTSFSNALFSSDRWRTNQDGNGTQTVTQQTFTPGTAPIAGYESQFFLRNTTSVVGTSTYQEIQQRIEDVRTLAGQTATVSFWAKADSSRTATLFLEQNFGSGGSGSVYPILSQSVSLTSSWQRFTFTVSVASISGKTIGTNSFLAFFIRFPAATSAVCDLWGVQIEASNTATAFQTATGTIQGELAACQRYYVRFGAKSGGTTNVYSIYGMGVTLSTTSARVSIPLPVEMRVAPTSVEWGNLAVNDVTNALFVPSAIGVDSGTNHSLALGTSATISGATDDRYVSFINNNNANGFIAASAEL
jgi:hypothetical protein